MSGFLTRTLPGGGDLRERAVGEIGDVESTTYVTENDDTGFRSTVEVSARAVTGNRAPVTENDELAVAPEAKTDAVAAREVAIGGIDPVEVVSARVSFSRTVSGPSPSWNATNFARSPTVVYTAPLGTLYPRL